MCRRFARLDSPSPARLGKFATKLMELCRNYLLTNVPPDWRKLRTLPHFCARCVSEVSVVVAVYLSISCHSPRTNSHLHSPRETPILSSLQTCWLACAVDLSSTAAEWNAGQLADLLWPLRQVGVSLITALHSLTLRSLRLGT